MQKFWKEHVALRVTIIALTFILGMVFVVAGWKMTGELKGLGIMLGGVLLLLLSLYIYNRPYEDRK